jgi:beta-RFAP synthase
MVDRPAVRLRICASEELEAVGPLADRAMVFANRWADFCGLSGKLPCRIEVLSAAPQHVGLGVGTQLGLSVAAGLSEFFRLSTLSPAELAISVGRGLRSAVGTYGFGHGGLIVDRGKLPGERIAPLDVSLPLSPQWRFVLIRPRAGSGLWGPDEEDAFDRLPPVPREVTADLIEEVRQRMVPAAASDEFDLFSESVHRFGRVAGMCFAKVQGGPYNGRRLSELVEMIQSMGVTGVGQSSWGPTLFAILPDDVKANEFVNRMTERVPTDEIDVSFAAANSQGASIDVS